jgi:hypothetical protein
MILVRTNHPCLRVGRHTSFPFASSGPPPDNLDSLFSSSPTVHVIAPPYPSSIAGTSKDGCHATRVPDAFTHAMLTPRAAPSLQLAPHVASTSTSAARVAPAPHPVPRTTSVSPSMSSSSSAPLHASPNTPSVPAMTSDPRIGSSVYHPVAMACDPHRTHLMVTCRAAGVIKPVDCLQFSTITAPLTLCLVTTSIRTVLTNPLASRYGGGVGGPAV